MRLVACSSCHAQYDVTNVTEPRFDCACGNPVENVLPVPVPAVINRCGSCGASIRPSATICEYCGSAVVRDHGMLSLICPECYARNPEARFCTNCGVEFRPQPVAAPGETYPCPSCREAMPAHMIGGVRVNECARCNGIWVSGDSFDSLIDRAIESRRARPSEGLGGGRERPRIVPFPSRKVEYRRCPVCDEFMQRRNFGSRSGVIVDWCGDHGTWLDSDELEAIADFILSGGLEHDGRVAAGSGPHYTDGTSALDAMAISERLMAEERAAQLRRRASVTFGPAPETTLGGLLRALLGW